MNTGTRMVICDIFGMNIGTLMMICDIFLKNTRTKTMMCDISKDDYRYGEYVTIILKHKEFMFIL